MLPDVKLFAADAPHPDRTNNGLVTSCLLEFAAGLDRILPVSSSAHLVLPAQLTNWPDQGLAFDVAVHFGTLIAVLAYFRGDLVSMLSAVSRSPSNRYVGLANCYWADCGT